MSEKFAVLFTLTTVLLPLACGGDPGGTTGTASQGQTGTEAGTGSGTDPTTGGSATTGAGTGGASQTGGQTTGPGDTSGPGTGSTGEPGTSSTGAAGTSSTGEPGTSSGGDLCADFKEPGCIGDPEGCPEGMECKMLADDCVPSACTCDPGTGMVACTPDCSGGTCVPACMPVICDLFCEFGFKKDAFGCDICECNEGPNACECKSDKECVKTSLGCCPCSAGGKEAPAHMNCVDQVMKCDIPPDQVNCPQVYLCSDAQPVCVNGACVLQ